VPLTLGDSCLVMDLAITYDDEAEVKKLYVNGELAVESNDAVAENDTKPFNIGAGGDTGTAYFFKGDIDDIGLWNIALSQEEIQGVMNNGVAGDAGGDARGTAADFFQHAISLRMRR